MNQVTPVCVVSFLFLYIIFQIFYWVYIITELYGNRINSKKDFIIGLIPGKFIIDIFFVLKKCIHNFKKIS